MNKILIWILTLSVFVFAGWLLVDNYWGDGNDPPKQAFVDFDAQRQGKVIVCPISFDTYEFMSDSTRRCNDVQLGNFAPVEVCFMDHNFFAYTNPVRHEIDWPGKLQPSPRQLMDSKEVKVYLPGAAILRVENFKRERGKCYFVDVPDEEVDEDL